LAIANASDPEVIEKLHLRFLFWLQQDEWAGSDYRRLKLVGQARGYHPHWAAYEYQRRRPHPHEGG
jgi:hypothetical protein